MSTRQDKIKEIIANILYLDSPDEIGDQTALFTNLGLSSIDYIDLCFELKQQFGKNVEQDNLWPLNKLLLDETCFFQNQWTEEGWGKICTVLKLEPTSTKQSIQKLYEYFSVNYIENRLKELS